WVCSCPPATILDSQDESLTGFVQQSLSKPIPAEFGLNGLFFRYEHHFVYWRHNLSNGDIGIVTILHESMHQIDRFRDDFGSG
ncbi:hypothetical protein PFC51_19865, partial [Paracoccus pantotrophus]|nr:hypothetical protein [Paracoccus pantotrophus]